MVASWPMRTLSRNSAGRSEKIRSRPSVPLSVRSYRLCQRVLMFHHLPEELGVDDYLVKSTQFGYREKPFGSFPERVIQCGNKLRPDGRYLTRCLPPLELAYTESPLDDREFQPSPKMSTRPISTISPAVSTVTVTAGLTSTARAFPAFCRIRTGHGSTSQISARAGLARLKR